MTKIEFQELKDGSRDRATSSKQAAKQEPLLWLYVSVAGSLLLRVSLLDFESADYELFLSKWYDWFLKHGRWQGLSNLTEDFASYPPLYMYLISLSTWLPLPKLYSIKLISIASDYVAAMYLWRLARQEFPFGFRAWWVITAFLFLPTVVMNGALWGQCDVMYTACFLASLFYLLKEREVSALLAFGLSCSLKPQAIFWCPLLAGLFVSGRLRWKWVGIPIAVYLACGIPALLAGRPLMHVLGHWSRVDNMPGLTLGATNWYQWVFEQHPEIFFWPGVVLTVVATSYFVLWMRQYAAQRVANQWLVSLALLSVTFPPFLLPGMHERYFFAADVLSLLYMMYVKGGWLVTLLIQFASAFTYLPYLFRQEPVPRTLLPLAVLAALVLVISNLARTKSQVNGREEHA